MGLTHMDFLCRLFRAAHIASHRVEPRRVSNLGLQLPRLHGKKNMDPKKCDDSHKINQITTHCL